MLVYYEASFIINLLTSKTNNKWIIKNLLEIFPVDNRKIYFLLTKFVCIGD